MRAMVVDDSRAVRRLIGEMLVAHGFKVEFAENGRVALDALNPSSLPDVALVDWNMPEMDGLEFIRCVRGDRALRRLPIMMVTTEIEAEQMVRALAAGADEYVMKPFTPETILEKLHVMGVL